MSRFPIFLRNSSTFKLCGRFIHETNPGVGSPTKGSPVPGAGQTHSTKQAYDSQVKSSRAGREATESTGYKPATIQKYFLVITRLYKNQKDIPEFVPAQTWQRFHDRIRAMVVVMASLTFTGYFLRMRDRTARKIVADRAKMPV